jgi:hypothetical protein
LNDPINQLIKQLIEKRQQLQKEELKSEECITAAQLARGFFFFSSDARCPQCKTNRLDLFFFPSPFLLSKRRRFRQIINFAQNGVVLRV